MTTFAALYLAHLIADFPLQTNRIYKLKAESNQGILLHVSIHLLVAAVLIEDLFAHWPVFLVLGVAHFLIDWTKLRFPGRRQTPGFLIDQLAHFLTIVVISFWQLDLPTVLPLWLMWWGILLILLPATLMFLWVWATDLRSDLPDNRAVSWASQHLLPLAQRIGMVFVMTLSMPTFVCLVI